MIVVKDKIIAFREGGEMLVFNSRAEFGVTDKEEENVHLIFASPSDLYQQLLRLEEVNESMKKKLLEKEKKPEWCEEVSEATVRAIRVREDERQKRLLEVGEK